MLGFISQSLPRLTASERRVAEWVLAHPRAAAESTVATVARAASTSEPSVIRFCHRIGLGGFRELTLRLTEALSRPGTLVHRDVSAGDSIPDATFKVVDAAIKSLGELRAELSTMPFDTAVAKMAVARQFVFAGLGASGHVAGDAAHKFFRLGVPTSALTDTPSIQQFAAIAGVDDVLLVVSKNGNLESVCNASREARANGAFVIAITDPASTLAGAASVTFGCNAEEDTNIYTPRSSRLVHLALLDALHVAVALALGEVAADNLERSKDALLTRKA